MHDEFHQSMLSGLGTDIEGGRLDQKDKKWAAIFKRHNQYTWALSNFFYDITFIDF